LYIIAWNLLFGLSELPSTSDGYYFLEYLEMWKSIFLEIWYLLTDIIIEKNKNRI
jgi:hypothetical protein